MTELSGKTILITGALGTLGRAQAERLGRAGAGLLLLLDRPGGSRGGFRGEPRRGSRNHGDLCRRRPE